ncbi:MAG: hypothetical protein IKL25_11485 [Clostridia bacterium]|nr:hypothetical protein [Clostridia bacterium]
MKHRMTILCLLLMLTFSLALAESPAVNDMALDLMGSTIHYPQLTGLNDPAVQSAVNAAIMEKGQINARLSRVAMLMNAPVKLKVGYTYVLEGDVFSCAILAEGAVITSRSTQVWSTVNYDLRTGTEITLDAVFTDKDAAVAFIEGYLDGQVAPELSAHLAAGSLTPIPASFTVSPTGLTLYYDIEDFRTLGDRAGTVTILWSEFPPELPALPMARTHLGFPADAPAAITAALADGSFPGVPAALGDPMQELIDRYALLTDPDIYEGGRMIALEDGAFRGVWILTDALTRTFDQSTVQGIRADRLNFHGLCTGVTTIDMWRAALGQPDTTLTVDEARAESWRIVPGTSDYYTLGDYRLRLHADENGILRSVFLTR